MMTAHLQDLANQVLLLIHSEAGSSGSRNRGVDNPRLNEVYMGRSSLMKEVGVYCLSDVRVYS